MSAKKVPAVVLSNDVEQREALAEALEAEGLAVVQIASPDALYARLVDEGYPDLLVLTTDGTGEDTLALLLGLQASERRPPVVVVAPAKARDQAAELVRHGAYASLHAPAHPDELRAICRRALRDAARRRELGRLRDDLEDFQAFLYSTLSHLFEGVMVIDPGARVLFVNKVGARLFLQPREELVGKRLDPKFARGFLMALKKARGTGEGWAEKRVELVSGEHSIDLDVRAVLLRELSGKPVGGLLTFRQVGVAADTAETEAEEAEAAEAAPLSELQALATKPISGPTGTIVVDAKQKEKRVVDPSIRADTPADKTIAVKPKKRRAKKAPAAARKLPPAVDDPGDATIVVGQKKRKKKIPPRVAKKRPPPVDDPNDATIVVKPKKKQPAKQVKKVVKKKPPPPADDDPGDATMVVDKGKRRS